jgi:hypothetical protein
MDHDKLDKLRDDVNELMRCVQYLSGEVKRLSAEDGRRAGELREIKVMIEDRDQH